jgi:hypothetical protein
VPLTDDLQLREVRVDKAVSDSIEQQLRSAFPDGTFTQVNVLGYGDDPDVEPGETAIRAFVDRAGHPAGTWQDDETVMRAFEKANSQAITWLHRDGQLPSIAWIQAIPDTLQSGGPPAPFCGASPAFSSACALTWQMRHRGSLPYEPI